MPAQPVSTKAKPDIELKTLADVLLAQGALTSEAAKKIKLDEIQSGKAQEEIIKAQNLVDETTLVRAKAKLYNVPYLDLNAIPTSPEALGHLPQEVAERFKIFPVSINKATKEMVLAMADPLNLTAIEFVEQKTQFKVIPHAVELSRIDEFIATRYATSLAQEVTAALREVTPSEEKGKYVEVPKGALVREEKVSEIVTQLLAFAVRARASDVHIEPQEKTTRVRYRIDGILQEKLTIPKALHDALVSRIKILSGLKIDEKRIPQDGRFNFKTEGEEIDLRVSSLPTAWGEKIELRLLKKTGGVPDLPELGLRGHALKTLQDAILRPHGIIIICGPTGAGIGI